jgi:hypothetical protein
MSKPFVTVITLLSCATVGWLGWRAGNGQQGKLSAAAPVTWQEQPPTLTVTDPGKIFERAFWRRPMPDDQILNAERREWSDEDGLQRWQWFLVVRASADLMKYLRDENAFGLVPSSAAPVVSKAPVWFRFDPEEVTVMKGPQTSMELMFSQEGSTIYATASGRGFTKGASEVPDTPRATPHAPVAGRLLTTPPPTPSPPKL